MPQDIFLLTKLPCMQITSAQKNAEPHQINQCVNQARGCQGIHITAGSEIIFSPGLALPPKHVQPDPAMVARGTLGKPHDFPSCLVSAKDLLKEGQAANKHWQQKEPNNSMPPTWHTQSLAWHNPTPTNRPQQPQQISIIKAILSQLGPCFTDYKSTSKFPAS